MRTAAIGVHNIVNCVYIGYITEDEFPSPCRINTRKTATDMISQSMALFENTLRSSGRAGTNIPTCFSADLPIHRLLSAMLSVLSSATESRLGTATGVSVVMLDLTKVLLQEIFDPLALDWPA